MAPRKLSPAARRKAAIARRFPHWSLTNEKPSRWLHIGASFRALDELSRIRSRWPFLSRHSRKWPWTGQLTIRKGKGGRGKVLHEAPMPEHAAQNFFHAAGLAEAE